MNATGKWAVGLGLASGVLLAALLVTTERGQKTRKFIVRRARELRIPVKPQPARAEESELHYI